jgi:molybdopterin-binding protein
MSEAAELLGVSDDTVRRWADAGRLPVERSGAGRKAVDGAALAAFAQELAGHGAGGAEPREERIERQSARNRFRGLVTDVRVDGVMAQVEMQAGPHRLVSLLSREAVEDLGLEPGALAVAVVKATNVIVEVPQR